MRIQTQKLRLDPDREVPGLKRLKFSATEVTVEDVFLKGIHPHSVVRAGNQHDYTGMADTILAKLNEPTAYLAELKAHSLGHEIAAPGYSMYGCNETPDPVDVDTDFASYHSATTAKGNVLHYERDYVVRQVEIPPEKAAEFRKLESAILFDEKGAAVLKKQ